MQHFCNRTRVRKTLKPSSDPNIQISNLPHHSGILATKNKIIKGDEYTRHEHQQTPTIFYLKLWTFALLFFSLDMECLGLSVCLWTLKWVGGPLVGDFGCAVFIVESTNPKNLD